MPRGSSGWWLIKDEKHGRKAVEMSRQNFVLVQFEPGFEGFAYDAVDVIGYLKFGVVPNQRHPPAVGGSA